MYTLSLKVFSTPLLKDKAFSRLVCSLFGQRYFASQVPQWKNGCPLFAAARVQAAQNSVREQTCTQLWETRRPCPAATASVHSSFLTSLAPLSASAKTQWSIEKIWKVL